MAQQTGRQYDDDLTVGVNDYSESFSTEFVDLFEPLSEDDAPIAKLKTIILSIDWEITDDILLQLHDELQDLKDVWSGNKINLIYIQALEKLGRYISVEKANSHPNAIKLLLAFYYDLEKIVSSASMSEEEKKQLLLQDVKKFEQFKNQIAGVKGTKEVAAVPMPAQSPAPSVGNIPAASSSLGVLTTLKALVLGIDWEISDSELVRLSNEVGKLEKIFSESRAKLIFLQGIGALGNYIRSAKSSANPDAFKLLHSFYAGLERICREVLSQEQEKTILLAEVQKFNAFKAVIATVASEVVVPVERSASLPATEEEEEETTGIITPAFADMPEDVRGFREDAEAVKGEIDNRVANFLGEKEVAPDQFVEAGGITAGGIPESHEVSSRLNALFVEGEEPESREETADIALLGVDVETEADDDSDEKALPFHGGRLAPALAEIGGQSLFAEKKPVRAEPVQQTFATPDIPGVDVETEADDESEEAALPRDERGVAPALAEIGGQSLFAEKESVREEPVLQTVAAPDIPGVDVETEADDESEEAALPRDEGGVAPALGFSDEQYGFREAEVAVDAGEEEFDLEDRLDSFFGAEIEEASQGSVLGVGGGVGNVLPAETASAEDFSLTEVQKTAAGVSGEEEEVGPASLIDLLELESEEGAAEEESAVLLAPKPEVAEEVSADLESESLAMVGEESLLAIEPEVAEELAAEDIELRVGSEVGEGLLPEAATAEEFSLTEAQETVEGVPEEEKETEPAYEYDHLGLASEEGGVEQESVVSFALEPEVLEDVLVEIQPEHLAMVGEESSLSMEPEVVEDLQRVIAEPLAEVESKEAPVSAGFTFQGVGVGVPVDVTAGGQEVVFEPVADDIEVDELPVHGGMVAFGEKEVAGEEYLTELRECVAAILLKKYDDTFPVFFAEIDRLQQGWQTQYVKNIFLQLLLIVGQYIDFHRQEADAESLALLQTLFEKLEQVCKITADTDNRIEQILADEIGKVLHWQQGLISALTVRPGAADDSSQVVDDLADLFSEK